MSTEQQIAAVLLRETDQKLDLEMIRDAASNIYYQYLSEKVESPQPTLLCIRVFDWLVHIFVFCRSLQASPRIKCSENMRKKIWSTIQSSSLSDVVFDEIQQQVRRQVIYMSNQQQSNIITHVCFSLFQVYQMLLEDSQYFPAFRVSQSYISLLAELDLLRDSESSTTADDGKIYL